MYQNEIIDLRSLPAQHFVNIFKGKDSADHKPVEVMSIDSWSLAFSSAQDIHQLLERWLKFSGAYGFEDYHILIAHQVGLGVLEVNHFLPGSQNTYSNSLGSAILLDSAFNDPIIKLGLNSSCCHIRPAENSHPGGSVACVWPWRHPSGSFGLLKCIARAHSMTPDKATNTAFITPYLLERMRTLQQRNNPAPSHSLTPRELDVLDCLAMGLSAVDASRKLKISRNTFDSHTKNIYRKLGVKNRQQAIMRAREDLSRRSVA